MAYFRKKSGDEFFCFLNMCVNCCSFRLYDFLCKNDRAKKSALFRAFMNIGGFTGVSKAAGIFVTDDYSVCWNCC